MRRPAERGAGAGRGRQRRPRGSGGEARSQGVRSFVAVLLPGPVQVRVAAAAAGLQQLGAAVSWVRAENLHLTVRFLGSVDEATLGRVRDALEEAAQSTAPFVVILGGLGGFPTARAPRVIWVGVEAGAEALGALYARIEVALARRGIPSEGRPFHAHVTLGRARELRGASALGAALEGPAERFGEVAVEAIHLMRSDLHPEGARYSVLARVPLAADAARVDSAEGGS